MDARAKEVLDFWIDGVGPERWYSVEAELDATIRERFGALWDAARTGAVQGWTAQPDSALALVILLDQFPRNMFRGDRRSFATDRKALSAAKSAIAKGYDERIAVPERQFFYLPLMHSENLADQERCVRLIALSFGVGDSLNHARAHREIIRRFGRFPYRNEALGRTTTPAEQKFLEGGGYPALVADFAA
jgi:uncharacterized protein (DUF924 family)